MRSGKRKIRAIFAAAVVLALAAATPAFAHKVSLFAYAEGETVFCEGFFARGPKAQNSKIEVYGPDGKKLLEGRTDKEGQFSFKAPFRADLKIVLIAGMGHRAEFVLHADELPDTLPAPGGEKPAPQPQKPEPAVKEKTSAAAPVTGVSAAEIKKIVSQELHSKLRPIREMLVEAKEERAKATITEILGGVGVIFGLAGIVALLRSRKKNSKE